MKSTNLVIGFSAAIALVACKKDEASNARQGTESPPAPAETNSAPKVTSGADTPTASASFAALAGTYKVDPVHAAVTFKVKHLGVSHSLGRFNKVSGELELGKTPAESSVTIEVATSSVFTADKKRDDHLKSPDFLNAAQYPTITFKSKSVKETSTGHYEVAGDLSLHGETRPVTATFELVGSGLSPMDKSTFLVGFTGELTIKRSDFGMANMVGPIGDEIALTIAVEAARQ